MSERLRVVVIDDNESVCESLPDLLRQVGLAVQTFASAEAFLVSDAIHTAKCLILDVGMPGMSGPALQEELKGRGSPFLSFSLPPTPRMWLVPARPLGARSETVIARPKSSRACGQCS